MQDQAKKIDPTSYVLLVTSYMAQMKYTIKIVLGLINDGWVINIIISSLEFYHTKIIIFDYKKESWIRKFSELPTTFSMTYLHVLLTSHEQKKMKDMK